MKAPPIWSILAALLIVPVANAQEPETPDHDDHENPADHEEHEDHDEHVVAFAGLVIDHPWMRAAARGADTLMFFEAENEGLEDTLLGAEAAFASSAEIVGLTLDGDRIAVMPVGPIEVGEGRTLFDPGGLAIALTELSVELVEGTIVEVTLNFAERGEIVVDVLVEAANALSHSHNH